jgi:HTH-type transcriptional regulator/antitoxin HipB
MSSMKDTPLRNPEQLGRSLRLKRLEKGLSQVALAARLGVERKWVIHLESGNPKAELGLILKALDALELQASLVDKGRPPAPGNSPETSRLDEVFHRLERRGTK